MRILLFSTLFLLPADAGGKIRTGNVLRGLKSGAFDVTLICPAPGNGPDTGPDQGQDQGLDRWRAALAPLADQVVCWACAPSRARWTRVVDLVRSEPTNVCHGITGDARDRVARTLTEGRFDVVVFDFVHATALMPANLGMATVCFTHNVEAEIFARHAQQAGNPAMRWMWGSQARKMVRYERQSLARYTSVIAMSARDAKLFAAQAARSDVQTIPTAVDLEFFSWQAPAAPLQAGWPTVVFTGSMDWAANIDGVGWFLADIWPRILRAEPQAQFVVVGRNAPAALVRQGAALLGVRCTGFVDDVRPHVRGAQVFTIPLRVGGGTRIKVFEAMAMGCPVVSTALGIEGLDVVEGEHLLQRESAQEQADAIVRLIREPALAARLSAQARQLVEQRFGHLAAAQVFERICLRAVQRHGGSPVVLEAPGTGVPA